MSVKQKKVVIMGMGYIGLPTAAMIASRGFQVRGVDVNPQVVEAINRGTVHIDEPDLEGLLKNCIDKGALTVQTSPDEADIFIIAVPTPIKKDYSIDLKYIKAATNSILPFLRKGNLVIVESTCSVGTTEYIYNFILSECPSVKDGFCIAYCPERVLPSNILHELKHNDRVIGGLTEQSTRESCNFYAQFVYGRLYQTDAKTAELCKLVENSYRDVNIAFANELSMICAQAGINVWELIQLANRHPRVNILQPGPGVGGHCIAVDPWFLISGFPEQAKLIQEARQVNMNKIRWTIATIKNRVDLYIKQHGRRPKVACMGLTFKPDVNDLRESPALNIAYALQQLKFDVVGVEPYVDKIDHLTLLDWDMAIQQCDLFVILVAHSMFKNKVIQIKKEVLDFVGILSIA